jgi:predicted transcriptional regulator
MAQDIRDKRRYKYFNNYKEMKKCFVKEEIVMSKTDKELTTEIVCSYINAWGSQTNCIPVKQDQLSNLIEDVYKTVANLGRDN